MIAVRVCTIPAAHGAVPGNSDYRTKTSGDYVESTVRRVSARNRTANWSSKTSVH